MRPPATALFVVALVLAGCAAAPTKPTPLAPESIVAAGSGFAFGPARTVATIPNSQHEAFVEVSPDGKTILTCAHGFFQAPSHFYASVDGGATFTELVVDQPMPTGGDCEVALSPDGFWAFAQKTDLGVSVVTTADGGETWVVNHLAGPPVNGGADRQWLAYAGDVLLLSYQPGSQQFGTIEVTRSTDDGATWSLPVRAFAPDPMRMRVHAGHFLVAPDGTLRIPLSSSLEVTGVGGSRLSFAVSRDAGATWREEPVASMQGFPPNPSGAAQAADGSLTWAYATDSLDLVAIGSSDNGTTWSDPVTLGSGMDWPRPWASARPDGTVDVVWLSDGSQFDADAPRLALARIDLRMDPPAIQTLVIDDIASIEYVAVAHDASGRATVVAADAPSTSSNPLGSAQLLVIQETTRAGPTA